MWAVWALWLSGLVLGLGYGALGVWDVTLHLRKILEARGWGLESCRINPEARHNPKESQRQRKAERSQ